MSTVRASTVREYDDGAPNREETVTATFALGCFWGPDAEFGAVDGVVRTRVGYAGGTKSDPTYHRLGDHTETFQVDYDSEEVSYEELLDLAFDSHNPNRKVRKTQYQNVIFVSDSQQRDALKEYLSERGLSPDSIGTRIEELSTFYNAEDYHQKHSLRSRNDLMDPFAEAGYDEEELRESPAAAKLNGLASGQDVPEELDPR